MRALPDIASLGRMRDQKSVMLTIAGVAFMRQVTVLLEPLGLTPSRSLALAYLDANPGADQTSLGKAMGMNRGSAMHLVDNLEQAGFVRRGPGNDRRSNALLLTAAGRRAFDEAMKLNDKILATTLSWMSESDWQVVSRLMESMLGATPVDA